MKLRVLVLPISAGVIAALCAYKLSRSDEPADANRSIKITRQARFLNSPTSESRRR
jgi:hypothetical protein